MCSHVRIVNLVRMVADPLEETWFFSSRPGREVLSSREFGSARLGHSCGVSDGTSEGYVFGMVFWKKSVVPKGRQGANAPRDISNLQPKSSDPLVPWVPVEE